MQRLQALHDFLLSVCGEEFNGLVNGHFQYIVDIDIMEFHFQRICLEAFAVAGFALQHKVRHELHLYGDGSFALALLATAAFTVEAEMAGGIAHLFGEGLLCPKFAYFVVGLYVGYRVGTRGLADRVLVYKLYVAQIS